MLHHDLVDPALHLGTGVVVAQPGDEPALGVARDADQTGREGDGDVVLVEGPQVGR